MIEGTKTDSLGETDFPTGWDNFTVGWQDTIDQLENEGYYTTSEGQEYFMMDIFFSDRLNGDIYLERHPVFLENVKFSAPSHYSKTPYNGVQDFGVEGDPTIDSAILWATLTDGQPVLTDEALALQAEDEEQHADVVADDSML